MQQLRAKARRLNAALFTLDRVYIENERKNGLKNSEVCLMYALDDGRPHSQKEISVDWEIPRTTLNTIIKQWEKQGLLLLRPIPGKKRDMEIVLTDEGRAHMRPYLDVIYRAEEAAMEKVLSRYSDEFIQAMELFHAELQTAFLSVPSPSKETK